MTTITIQRLQLLERIHESAQRMHHLEHTITGYKKAVEVQLERFARQLRLATQCHDEAIAELAALDAQDTSSDA